MIMLTVHHFGYLIKSLEKSRPVFQMLGYASETGPVYDPDRDITLLLLKKDSVCLELIEPGTNSPLKDSLLKLRNTAYHICYETESILQAEQMLLQGGFIRVQSPRPAVLFGERRVAFYAHAQLGLIELLENESME